jgi:hypothetical protein
MAVRLRNDIDTKGQAMGATVRMDKKDLSLLKLIKFSVEETKCHYLKIVKKTR